MGRTKVQRYMGERGGGWGGAMGKAVGGAMRGGRGVGGLEQTRTDRK